MAAESFRFAEIIVPCVIGAAASIGIELLAKPRPRLLARPFAGWLLHSGIWLLAFAFELALFHRPYFAVFNILAFVLLIVLVSNAKWSSLGEPFIYQDFEYFLDAIKHPRLYLPFFGPWFATALAIAFAALFYFGLSLETPLSVARFSTQSFTALFTLVAFGASFLMIGSRLIVRHREFSLDAGADLKKFGLVASMWQYRQLERLPIALGELPSRLAERGAPTSDEKRPHFVVVQSESFFDARRLFSGLRKDVLVQWDQVNEEARTCGQLHVAAWGANTVRTEFAFLSGMTPGDLGVHRFNPYRKLARSGINTVATLLKKQGYRTICVHPYLASFYSRNEVFPLLGFDEFIDIESFEAADKVGPYIGDVSVADKVIEQLKGASQPTFIFAITMENHGPLHWEKVGTDEANTLFEKMPPAECDDLVVFARHLRNADAMLGKLTQYLRASASPAWVCMYGDHVPIMPKVYQALGTPSGTTDYCIWGNAASGAHIKARSRADMNVSDLASLLLRCAAEEELIS